MRNSTKFSGSLKKFLKHFRVSEKLVRYWHKESLKEDPAAECSYGYITQVVRVSKEQILAGIQPYDTRYPENKYPMIEYYDLNDLEFVFVPADAQEDS